jgi:hypothetical protein
MTDTKYYYCFLRKDLYPFGPENPAYLIIQASHACFEMARRLPAPAPGEQPASMVLFEVANEEELFQTYRYLKFNGLIENEDFHVFFEPDHETGFTAICTRPFEGRQKMFNDFQLFGSPECIQEDLHG